MMNVSQNLLRFGVNRKAINYSRMMSSLIQNQAYINGKWTSAKDNKIFDVTNPANMNVIAKVPDMSKIDCQSAIDSAHEAFYRKDWHNLTAKDRSALLKVQIDQIHFMY
jgi:succinate-semialdehyde dehydrogenase/glutarate-semialdehyde dehydrogenase